VSDESESTISKKTPVTIGLVLVICMIVAVSVTGTVKASFATEKVQTLEKSLKKLVDAQYQVARIQARLTSSATVNRKKSDENGELLKKLGEVQIKQQLILNTQKIELRYIKEGVDAILKRGG